jgi:hypothetical protein
MMKCKKIFTTVIILLALILGICAIVLPPENLEKMFIVSKFFEAMLPVLAAGGLIKYLASCPSKCPCPKCEGTCSK